MLIIFSAACDVELIDVMSAAISTYLIFFLVIVFLYLEIIKICRMRCKKAFIAR